MGPGLVGGTCRWDLTAERVAGTCRNIEIHVMRQRAGRITASGAHSDFCQKGQSADLMDAGSIRLALNSILLAIWRHF